MERARAVRDFGTRRFKEFKRLIDLHDLSVGAICRMPRLEPLAAATTKYRFVLKHNRSPSPGEIEKESSLKESRRLADLARREVREGFDLLNGQTAVLMWGWLEAAVRDLVIFKLEQGGSTLQNEKLGSLRVQVNSFMQLEVQERTAYLVDLFERNSAGALKKGVGRFRPLLELIGAAPATPELVKKVLLECQQVRNVLVHKGGRTDRRLLLECPWLDWSVGSRVKIGGDRLVAYIHAVGYFFTDTVERCATLEGAPMQKGLETGLAEGLRDLEEVARVLGVSRSE